MACFTVPLATAVAATAAKSVLPASTRTNPFVAKLGWLGKMMFGGSFLLAIDPMGRRIHGWLCSEEGSTLLPCVCCLLLFILSVMSLAQSGFHPFIYFQF